MPSARGGRKKQRSWDNASTRKKESIMAMTIDHPADTVLTHTDVVPPIGPRVRWSGVMSGLFIAVGVLILLTALGLAIGITALGDPRTATSETASGLGVGAGIWTFITLLIAYFFGGMISSQVTDRPDRTGAVIHGALVWVLFMLFLLWMMVSGISLGLTGLFGTVRTLAQGAGAVGMGAVAAGGDLTSGLGLNDPNQVLARLDDPNTATVLASATGMSNEEARAALSDLRSRVEAVKEDPARVAAEVRTFVGQYTERVRQRAMEAAAATQERAAVGSWVTFGVMVVTLIVAIVGAMTGVPNLQQWRETFVRTRN
jgi:hypothetical protein